MKTIFHSKDQNSQDESTIYWFNVKEEGEEDAIYGIVESGCEDPRLLDCDGAPVDLPNSHDLEVISECEVTEAMRMDY